MKLKNLIQIATIAATLVACNSDDDGSPTPAVDTNSFPVPATYNFTNEAGNSSVSFGGQTTRLAQGKEILSLFTTFGTTEEAIDNRFAKGEGFTDASLNSSKLIRSKVAASTDYFSANSVEQGVIRTQFDTYIADQVTTFLSKYASKEEVPVATKGNAGILGGKRFVTAKGLELNQAFNKGLIGAWTLDQIANHYLSRLDEGTNKADNDAEKLVEGKPYTSMEHFWDEAYGYLYGASTNLENPNSVHLTKDGVVDSFLYKYVQRVNGDDDFDTYATDIYNAFKKGRAAIVAKKYTERDKQADIIRKLLSEVIGIRAVYYLQQGKEKLKDIANINDGSAFHDLSEGYGFVYSLRFTQDPKTGAPYFTKAEVDGFIAKLNEGNGFWDLADNTKKLDEISEAITAKFDFTLDQAAE